MRAEQGSQPDPSEYERWTCPNHDPPVLLAMVDDAGRLQIKVRNRMWVVNDYGSVVATCPKCGARHIREIANN